MPSAQWEKANGKSEPWLGVLMVPLEIVVCLYVCEYIGMFTY